MASGGTNLRVAFVELLGEGRLRRHLERSWPIQEHLKNENAEGLFSWIGQRVAGVVREGCAAFGLAAADELPMGVTFSFPMRQGSLSQATLMAMGKGFAITSDLDLGAHLLGGYEKHRAGTMPPIRVAAISNDAVATLVSFMYQFAGAAETEAQAGTGARPRRRRAAMGLIVGTGCNATIPLKLSSLHPSKRPASISVLPGRDVADVRIAVNTEWSINGTAPPLRALGLVTRWDEALDAAGEAPGFQPLEYMTAGRYLGELVRLMFIDYVAAAAVADEGLPAEGLPARLRLRFGLSTTFLSHFYPRSPRGRMLDQLEREFPFPPDASAPLRWTEPLAHALYRIAKAIETRAAGIVAAATVALLRCAGEIENDSDADADADAEELVVGYTGGCIQYFQDYLADTQRFVDDVAKHYGPARVVLQPCHDGGITGAGILVPAALAGEVVKSES